MIATGKFVFVHLHKSGGSFINQCLLRFFPDAQQLGYHLPLSRLPDTLRRLPVLGFVRSPWSYYVSWFAFQSQRPRPNVLFRCVNDEGRAGFAGTVRNLLHLGDDETRLNRLLALLPDQYGAAGFGLNLPRFALEPIRASGKGFYSYLFDYMYATTTHEPFIGRCENLRADFIEFFDKFDIATPPGLREFVSTAPAMNTSRHDDWHAYYDQELADEVSRYDAGVIDRFDYRLTMP